MITTDRRDAKVFALSPYDWNTAPITPRDADFIYREQGGARSTLTLTAAGNDLAEDGFTGSATLGVARD